MITKPAQKHKIQTQKHEIVRQNAQKNKVIVSNLRFWASLSHQSEGDCGLGCLPYVPFRLDFLRCFGPDRLRTSDYADKLNRSDPKSCCYQSLKLNLRESKWRGYCFIRNNMDTKNIRPSVSQGRKMSTSNSIRFERHCIRTVSS